MAYSTTSWLVLALFASACVATPSVPGGTAGGMEGGSSPSAITPCSWVKRPIGWEETTGEGIKPRSFIDGALGSYSGSATWAAGNSSVIQAQILLNPSVTPSYVYRTDCSDPAGGIEFGGTVQLTSSDGALAETQSLFLASPNGDLPDRAPPPCLHGEQGVAEPAGTLRAPCSAGPVPVDPSYAFLLASESQRDFPQQTLRLTVALRCHYGDGSVQNVNLLSATLPLQLAATW